MPGQQKQLRLPMDASVGVADRQWVRHAGVEAASNRLALWLVHGGCLRLSSETPAGKSHLLRLIANEWPQCGLLTITDAMAKAAGWRLVQQWVGELNSKAMWLLDVQAGPLPASIAYAIFHCLERARDMQRPLVISWRGDATSCPPELSSRLNAMEMVTLTPPTSDEDLLAIMKSCSSRLQWEVREQMLQSMLVYLPRRLDLLLEALAELEALSFEQQQKPSGAWLKQQLTRIAGSLQKPLFA